MKNYFFKKDMNLSFFYPEKKMFEVLKKKKKPCIKPNVSNSLINMQSPFKFKHVV